MNDFWLNEGFTVWAERRILEKLEGDAAVALSAAIGRHALSQEIARFGEDSPYTALETDLSGVDPDDVYSQVPYEKGCLFVQLVEKTVGRERMDAFVLKYMDTFQFTSLDTAEFEAFFHAEFPELREAIDTDRWIHGTGVPENAPSFHSERLAALRELTAGWEEGRRPDPEDARRWPSEEWQIFLQNLPRPMKHEDCLWLERTFQLNESDNAEILCQWLVIAAASAYEPAYEKLRSFLGHVGRMKYLKPLYTTLHKGEKTKALASELFEAFGDRYHPIARGGLENILRG